MFVFKSPLFYLILDSECQIAAGDNSDVPKIRCKGLPLSERVKALNTARKNSFAKVARIQGKNESSVKF